MLAGTARRLLRTLARRGLGDEEDDSLARDEPLLAALTAASLRSRIATGPEAGRPWHRLGDGVEPAPQEEGEVDRGASLPPRCVRHGGMSLHADVAVPARDRRQLERLCRYLARPASLAQADAPGPATREDRRSNDEHQPRRVVDVGVS